MLIFIVFFVKVSSTRSNQRNLKFQISKQNSIKMSKVPQLNPQYFRYLTSLDASDSSSDSQNVSQYHVFEPIGNPILLMAKDSTPLAAIHLTSKNNQSKALIYQRNERTEDLIHFQGMVTESNREFEFVLTNLTDFRTDQQKEKARRNQKDDHYGMLNINLMMPGQSTEIKQVNPGGLNQWNEVSPFRSAVIESDQNSKPFPNSRLILRDVFVANAPGGPKEALSVEQDEKNQIENKNSKSAGAYYFPTVLAQTGCPALEEKFKQEKFWIPAHKVPFILIQTTTKRPEELNRGFYAQSFSSSSRGVRNNKGINDNNNNRGRLNVQRNFGFESLEGRILDESTEVATTKSFQEKLDCVQEKKAKKSHFGAVSNNASWSSVAEPIPENNNNNKDVIMSSTVAEVVYGAQVDFSTVETNADYHWNLPAPVCRISLSVQPKLKFLSSGPEWIARSVWNTKEVRILAQEMLNQLKQGKYIDFLKQTTFKGECYICLNESPEVDIVFYPCAHQCLHEQCSKQIREGDSCGICRSKITAKLQIFS
jgi:hypothetical protein